MNQPTAVADRRSTEPSSVERGPAPPSRRRFPLRVRQAVLTAHIVFSVALLGDSAGFLAVAIRTSTLDDPALIRDSLKTLNMLASSSASRGASLRCSRASRSGSARDGACSAIPGW